MDKIGYNGSGTNILTALQVASEEINSYSKHSLTVVGEYTTYKSAVDIVTYVKGKYFV
jgi:hypothetical protein